MTLQHFDQYPLSDELKQALEALHFHTPTPVQHETLSVAFSKQDLIVKSQTGSGKTAAYGLPICEMVDWAENKPQALILVPTNELAAQVTTTLKILTHFCTQVVRYENLSRKEDISVTRSRLAEVPDIVVATPSRINQFAESGDLKFDTLKHVVIDEADLVLSYGHDEALE